ncbi:DUF4962 domain-containing protein [Cohnella sp. CFH 77786]|uniref:DUF4962 domain-containing protein n=1 Tax=Cohnella sp. CFH 77786 TaxID=2662265 RepID=UPI001C609143|nr:DUF4962 domain-containing protein [Cohnella sp. CFH 77786]
MVWVDRKTNAKTRKSLIWVMAVVLAFGCFGGLPFSRLPAAHAAPAWPASSLTGLNIPFGPADGLVTTQNPPDFHWPAIAGADQYDLQVSRSSTVTDVVYENDSLTANYYNFPHVFDAGTWYWRVKYHKSAEGWSEWSAVRKFRIEEQNVPFPVPPVEDIMGSISSAHPRIWTTSDTLDDFQGLAQTTGRTIYESKLASVTANLNAALPPEPDFPYDPSHPRDKEYMDALTKLRAESDRAVNMMADAAFLYLVTGKEKYGREARRRLNSIAAWNPDGDTGYVINDQVHRYIALRSAMAYDWIYDFPELTDGEKTSIRNMIVSRTNTMVTDLTSAHKIWENPYDSHGWTNFGYIGIIAIALLHDAPAAENWFRSIVPAYINIMPPWGGEDGGWSQGTGYWQWSSLFGKEFTDVLLSASGFNLYDKAYSRNEGSFPLYMFPHGSPGGAFGDGSEDSPGRPSVSIYNRLAQMYGDPRFKWAAEAIGSGPGDEPANYFYGDAGLAVRPPVDLPDSRWFRDTGMVAMHSKLYDPDRVSLYFKSSPYGSFNHSHADQNSFVVKAFGESLAVESGFYDEYFTDHDKFYGKQTFASNAITFDGKQGQPINNIDADGRITGFVTHPDFDATSGDASAAYMGALTRADRKIIYVRPQVFVVIDQLASANPAGSEFEWRLHADNELDLDGDNAGATILKGDAALKVRLHSPAGLRTTYEDKFLDQNGIERPPGGKFAGKAQKHAAFITPKTTATTIVSTMEAYKRDGVPQQAAAENHGDYMKLPFADGSVVYVRMGTSGVVNADGLTFDGAAVAVKGDTVLLVDGKKVVKEGVTLIDSSQTATIVYGKDRLSVSSQADTEVAVHAPGLTRVREDDSGADIPQGGTAAEAMASRGAYWTVTGDTLNLQVEQGQRAFKLNNAPVPEPMGPVTLQTEIDGVPGTITLQRHSDTEGNPVAWGKLGNASGLYQVLEAPPGFLFATHGKPDSVYLEADAPILLQGAPGIVKLRKMGADTPSQTVLWENPDEMRETTPTVWQEAEAYTASGDQSFTVYTTRKFLSGGAGIANWVTEGSWGKWQINVPKAGTYDLVLKYVSGWGLPQGELTSRLAMIGDKPYYFETPTTVDWGTVPENWRGIRVKTGQQLNAGPIDITLWTALGPMNMDWIGLIEVKDDEVLPSIPGNVQLVGQTDTTATISWTASTDNVEVKEYAVYVNGVQNTVVPSGSLTATVTGLTTGQTYAITLRAVDSSGNRSQASAAVSVTMRDVTAPVWGDAVSVRIVHLFPKIAKLTWDSATDNSGTAAVYKLYRSDQPGQAVEVSGNAYDVTGLTPGATYAFKVEAKDALGNESTDGPTLTLTMPSAGIAGEYYETFDNWPKEAANGDGWSFTRNFGTIVETVPLPDPASRALKVLDNYADPSNEWAVSPIVQKTTAPLSGKVTFETRFIANKVGFFELMIGGAGTDLIRFTAYSDGTFGYWRNNTPMRIPNPGAKLPTDQWMTLRFDADMDAKRYDITMQTDAFKNLAGEADFPGNLDKTAGIYKISGLKFYNDNESVSTLNSFVFRPSRYTGQYLFDYVTMYKTNIDAVAPTTTDNAPAGWVGEDVTVTLTPSDNEGGSGVAATYYKVDGGPQQTGTSVNLTLEGVHTLTYWSTDRAGNKEAERTVAVKVDKTSPVTVAFLNPGEPNGGNGWYTSDVTLSLSASDDGGSGAAKTEYRVNEGDWIPYTGSIPSFGGGIYKVDYRSTDVTGHTEEIHSTEFKIDKTAPTLTVELDPTSIWPPNGQMVTVHAALQSKDEGSGVASVVLTSITSNEPDSEQHDIQADIGTEAASFGLRAERSGEGTGRIYTVTYTATDKAGNQTILSATVEVPHDPSGQQDPA